MPIQKNLFSCPEQTWQSGVFSSRRDGGRDTQSAESEILNLVRAGCDGRRSRALLLPYLVPRPEACFTVGRHVVTSSLYPSRPEARERRSEDSQESGPEESGHHSSAYGAQTFLFLPSTCCVCHPDPHAAPRFGAGWKEVESGKLLAHSA